MNNIKSLRNFGTIYLWIFAFEVIQVCGDAEHRTETDTDRAAIIPDLLMKPYAYQIFDDDYTDDLMNERTAVGTQLWQRLNRRQQQEKQQLQDFANKRFLPLIMTKTPAKIGNSMTAREITFEYLNDFDSHQAKHAIWPKKQHQQQPQYHVKINGNGDNDIKPARHSWQQYFVMPSSLEVGVGAAGGVGGKQKTSSMLNIRFKENGLQPIPIIMAKHWKAQATRVAKKSKTPFNDANTTNNNNNNNNSNNMEGVNKGDDDIKENVFPSKDDNTSNANDAAAVAAAGAGIGVSYENAAIFADDENGIANSNGNGNESFNYADNNEANNNYIMAHASDNDDDDNRESTLDINRQTRRISAKPLDKRAKPALGRTPFLPAVSGGAMTNLGKFFRDLSKNVHVNEQHQWNAEEQKLLTGEPSFSDIHHHLSKPNAATDEQTAEWIKAIRFYRPSQKIRSLVAMNPHGQWAHNSQFIDPNYMWVGLGK